MTGLQKIKAEVRADFKSVIGIMLSATTKHLVLYDMFSLRHIGVPVSETDLRGINQSPMHCKTSSDPCKSSFQTKHIWQKIHTSPVNDRKQQLSKIFFFFFAIKIYHNIHETAGKKKKI